MKKIYFSFIILCPLFIQAQITVTSGDLPTANIAFRTAHDSLYNAAITPGGMNQTWNYSTLQNVYQDTTAFVAASATPFAAQFPNANLATYNAPSNSYSYFISNTTGFYINGGTNNGITGGNLIYNPPLTFVPVPFTYQSLHNDYARIQFDSTGGTFPLRFIHRVENIFMGDGFGSLQLPNATYNNTLRVKIVENTYDSVLVDILHNGNYVMIVPPTITHAVHYRWFRNGVAAYLLGIDADSAGTTATNVEYLIDYAVGISHLPAPSSSFSVIPNPAFDRTHLIFPPSIHSLVLKITDAQGKMVDQITVNENDLWLDVKSYNAGWYLLSFDKGSQHYNAKLLVNKEGE